ncbi:MAG: NAD(+)/NADH kinase [Parachlamydiaceae bacterium]
MIIALFHNTGKKQSRDIAIKIVAFLQQHSITVVAEDDDAASIGAQSLSSIPEPEVNFCITLGGDGTILRLVHKHPNLQVPILAINLGSLGFMADITTNHIEASLKNLINGCFQIESRMVIEGKTPTKQINFAINEIVVHRSSHPSLINLAIYVDGRYLNTFSADGVIVSTPSGSTAYSLAAGGPILVPELNALVLTPICPHTISNRPIVLLPEQEIRIEYIGPCTTAEVAFDGVPCYALSTGESVSIVRSNRLFRLVNMPDHDYFATLRSKLEWSGGLKNTSL